MGPPRLMLFLPVFAVRRLRLRRPLVLLERLLHLLDLPLRLLGRPGRQMREARRDAFDERVADHPEHRRPELDVGLVEASLDRNDRDHRVPPRNTIGEELEALVRDPRLQAVAEVVLGRTDLDVLQHRLDARR